MSDFLNNLGKIGMVLQAGGGSLAGRDGMAVVRDWEKQQQEEQKRKVVADILAGSGIGGPQRALLEQMPTADAIPTALEMMAQMEAQRRAAASAGAAKAREAAERESMLRAYEAFQGGGAAPQPGGLGFSTGTLADGETMPPSQPLSFGRTMPPAAIEQSVLPPAANDSWVFPSTFPNANPRANSVVAQSPALASRPVPPVVSPQEVPPANLSFGQAVTTPAKPRSEMTPYEKAINDMNRLMSPRSLALRGVDPKSPSYLAWEMAWSDAERKAELNKPPEDKSTGNITDYRFYVENEMAAGRTPMSFQEFLVSDEKAGNPALVGGVPADEAKLRETLAGEEAKVWGTYLAAGGTSAGSLADMQLLDELITMAPQGPVTGRLAAAFPGVNNAADAFTSVVNRVAPTLRAEGSGSQSDIEYAGYLRSLPQLVSRPEANRAIVAMMKAKARINIERAQVIRDYQSEDITVKEARRRLRELDERSIITPELQDIFGALAPEPENSIPTYNPETGAWE